MKIDSKKSNKYLYIASYVFFLIYTFSASMICGVLCYLQVLPLKYLTIIFSVFIILAAIFAFFIFRKKTKSITRYIILALEVIVTIIYIVIFFFLNSSLNLISALQSGGYQIEEYIVVTLKNTPYNTLEDLNGHTLAIYSDTSAGYQNTTKELKEKGLVIEGGYEDAVDSSTALLENRVNSILLKSALKDVVNEIIPDFNEKTQIVYTTKVKSPVSKTDSKDTNISEEPFNLYISGIDTRGDVSTVSRSDVNMIVTINPKTYQVLLTSIPRDYYVQLHGTSGYKDKLTHSGLYGINMTIDTIEDVFGIDINYYLRLNFDSTEKIINTIGGIDLTPDTTFSANYENGGVCNFYAYETIHVDGACGLVYARTRKAYTDGDFHRIQNQQEVLTAIIDRLTTIRSFTTYTSLLSTVEGSIETNIPTGQIYKLINLQLDKNPHWNIERIRVGGTSSMDYTYSITTEPLYILIPDESSVAAARDKINAVLSATPSK